MQARLPGGAAPSRATPRTVARNCLPSTTDAAITEAVSGPTPGMLSSLRLTSFDRCQCTILWSITEIRHTVSLVPGVIHGAGGTPPTVSTSHSITSLARASSVGGSAPRNPMRPVFAAHCPRAASGHAAAVPPSVNMDSRRRRWIAMRPSRWRSCACNRGNDITL